MEPSHQSVLTEPIIGPSTPVTGPSPSCSSEFVTSSHRAQVIDVGDESREYKLSSVSVHHKPSHYNVFIEIRDDDWFLFDDGNVKAATFELKDGNVSFDSSHLGGVTTVVYKLQQGDEADGGDPVSPEKVRAHQDEYQLEYQRECADWKLNSQRLASVAKQVLKVVSEGCRGEGGGRRMRENSSRWW
jgi:hypothetical protein